MSGYISGVDRHQVVLFPASVDEYIGAENEVRVIDAFVDLLELEKLGIARAVPAATGRPAYDPRDLVKLYIYGYLNRVRSSRRLEKECRRNVEVMWLVRQLEPDHKTIAEFRRVHAKQLKGVCAEFVVVCREAGLVGGEKVGVDGAKIRAVNSKQNNYMLGELEDRRAKVEAKIARYLAELDEADEAEEERDGEEPTTAEGLRSKLEALRKREEKYRRLLARLEEEGKTQISLTDPESRRMKVGTGQAVCYNAQIAVDAKHHLIVAHEVTNEENDLHQLTSMAVAAKEALEVETLEVAADTGYHHEDELAACEEAGIPVFVPRPQSANADTAKGFAKSDFTYLPEQDAYRCPAGQLLEYRHDGRKEGRTLRYYRSKACAQCPLRVQCTKESKGRRIGRTAQEDVVERAEARLKARPEMMRLRRCLVEHPYGTIKHWSGQGFFLMKGLKKVRGEFSLSVLSYNLRRAINVLGVVSLVETLKARKAALMPG